LGLTKNIYSKIINRVVKVDNIETAEFTKLFENTYRSVNIALVNELKILAKKTNLDINKIISAAKTKPFGFQAFMPGPGVGGHCIPVDPYYLNWFANRNKIKLKFIEHAGKINKLMPKWIIKESEKIKKIKQALILGITYKKNISDTRESPAIDFIKILTKKNIKVDYHDPFVQVLKTRKLKKILKSVNLKNIGKYDIVYLLTDHDCLNYEYIKKNSKLIIDTKNIYKKEINNKIIKL
jgi:UDP-N-acetyl-D-glucosamine dehydrogenase